MKSAKPRDFKSRYLIVSFFRVTRLRQLCTAIAHLDRAQTRRRYAAPAIIRIFQQPLSRTRRPWFLEAVSTHSQDYHPQNAGAHFPPKMQERKMTDQEKNNGWIMTDLDI